MTENEESLSTEPLNLRHLFPEEMSPPKSLGQTAFPQETFPPRPIEIQTTDEQDLILRIPASVVASRWTRTNRAVPEPEAIEHKPILNRSIPLRPSRRESGEMRGKKTMAIGFSILAAVGVLKLSNHNTNQSQFSAFGAEMSFPPRTENTDITEESNNSPITITTQTFASEITVSQLATSLPETTNSQAPTETTVPQVTPEMAVAVTEVVTPTTEPDPYAEVDCSADYVIVHHGMTLNILAKLCGVSKLDLIKFNVLTDPNHIVTGDDIFLHGDAPDAAQKRATTTTVKP